MFVDEWMAVFSIVVPGVYGDKEDQGNGHVFIIGEAVKYELN